jgi:hypothetical protein
MSDYPGTPEQDPRPSEAADQAPYGPAPVQPPVQPPAQPEWQAQPPPPGYPAAPQWQPGPPPGQYPYPYVPALPTHPQAGLALGLGLAGVVGGFFCVLPVLASPFAWAIGHRSLREIRDSRGQLDGEGMALTGMVLGIVGTALLGLVVIGLIIFTLVVASGFT